jgi:hypothetical protein
MTLIENTTITFTYQVIVALLVSSLFVSFYGEVCFIIRSVIIAENIYENKVVVFRLINFGFGRHLNYTTIINYKFNLL